MKKLSRELEEAVVDAWPAADTADLDGWLLRASGGPTRRGNSVATLEAGTELELPARLERAEAWYLARARAAMFQIGPCVAPAELDHELAARGYHKEGEAALALAAAPRVAELTASAAAAFETSVAARASADWSAVSADGSRHAARPDVYRGFLARLGSRCRYVLCRDQHGRAVAACLGVTSEERMGVHAMFTLPEARRRGAARALLHTLAAHATREHMDELFLLVELDNAAARALYEQSGFRDLYTYHYRTQPSAR